MKLTPLDIRRNEFTRALRGYNREEVENFLAVVADEAEQLVGEHRELTRRVAELQREIEDFRKLERTLMDTLVTAQHTSDEMRESSQREGEVIRREAQVRAEQLVENARIEAERLLMEARHGAHTTLEEARRKAHEALESARKQADATYDKARQEAADIERQMKLLAERRDMFVAGIRTYLAGQLQALAILTGAEPPRMGPLPKREQPVVTKAEAEALAALDRELSEFAAATAPTGTPRREAVAATSVPGEAGPPKATTDAGTEVLIDRQAKGT